MFWVIAAELGENWNWENVNKNFNNFDERCLDSEWSFSEILSIKHSSNRRGILENILRYLSNYLWRLFIPLLISTKDIDNHSRAYRNYLKQYSRFAGIWCWIFIPIWTFLWFCHYQRIDLIEMFLKQLTSEIIRILIYQKDGSWVTCSFTNF